MAKRTKVSEDYEKAKRRDVTRLLRAGEKNRLTFFYFSDRVYRSLKMKDAYYILYN